MNWPDLVNRLDLLAVGLIALVFWGTDKLMEVIDRRF
jgi:Sec-independent protein translocase protein TatA